MQQFAVVDGDSAYLPLQGFTTADLGLEPGDAVSNMVTKFEGSSESAQFMAVFDQIWSDPKQLHDVTEAVYEHIASVYAENSPARIYFLILYNLFSEFLEDISEDVLPNDRTGYQETLVWKSICEECPHRYCAGCSHWHREHAQSHRSHRWSRAAPVGRPRCRRRQVIALPERHRH